MKLLRAQTAGFCMGVDLALRKLAPLIGKGNQIITFGPIIHNPQVLAEYEAKGVITEEDPERIPPYATVVIRGTPPVPR